MIVDFYNPRTQRVGQKVCHESENSLSYIERVSEKIRTNFQLDPNKYINDLENGTFKQFNT